MKKALLLSAVFVCVLGMTVPAHAAESMPESPVLSEEDRPALPPHVKQTDVVAVFAKPLAQPAPAREGAQQKLLDTIWIYYADNTFDQYADMDGRYVLFSKGTYSLDGSFKEGGSIVINRSAKMSAETNALAAYESSHEYQLGTLGFELLGNDGILAIFGDTSREEYTDADNVTKYLDAFWVFFKDGTFKQYVFRDGNVSLHSSGSYEFDDIGDFHMPFDDKDHGTITLKWDSSENPAEHTEKICDLNTLGYDCLFERLEEEDEQLQ